MDFPPTADALLASWRTLKNQLDEHVEWVERGTPEVLDPLENIADLRRSVRRFDIMMKRLRPPAVRPCPVGGSRRSPRTTNST